MKNEKTKLIIWAVVALVIGVIIGMIITNVTTGNAKAALNTNATKQITINPEVKAGLDCVCNGVDTMCFGFGPDGAVDCVACCKATVTETTLVEQ